MENDLIKLSKIFKALSNENRLDLYLRIKNNQEIDKVSGKSRCFIKRICVSLNIGAPTISHHLKELVNAELIFSNKEGKYMTCSVNQEILDIVIKEFSK